MISYLAKRLLGAFITLLLFTVITFVLLRFAPGSPFESEHLFAPEAKIALEQRYGLDRPVAVQYLRWLNGMIHGDWDTSYEYVGQPVIEIIRQTLPFSLWLGFWALLFSILIGVPLGAIAAAKSGTFFDGAALFIAISGVSLPAYLVASLLVLLFSLHLGWLPPALWDGPFSLIMPVITLGVRPMAMIARLTRASMIESLHANYIRTAKAKGLSPLQVIGKHGLRNSLIPVMTVLGPVAASLLTGTFLVEVVFQLPGMGKYFVSAVVNRDYPLVMGVNLVFGIFLVSMNLLVDLFYGWVDPRIRR